MAWPALLVVIAAAVQEVGAAFAVGLFAPLGVTGTVFARFAVAAVVLCVAVRPTVRGLTRHAYRSVAALSVSLTTMNLCFYEALSRIPLGVAVTVEICGPLILSVMLSRRRSGWAWAALAFAGVALLGLGRGHLPAWDALGLVLAAGAAIGWAGYILATAHAGRIFPSLDALALASAIGAALTAPAAAMSIDTRAAASWTVVGLAILVGLMCSVIPYSLELTSLRTLPPHVFAIVTSLSPAIAALAGWVVLSQRLGPTDYVAIGLVVTASIGAVRSQAATPPAPPG
ncbi:putative permease, DMT superfamily [Mycolicibacterium chubuense NBB4]|uniref:Putative permease, DMT superfamily n=1 Tax=Mycolicibacterium chubuense (strain NBB4) TaxID=710421 RepID=I4BGQ8_MYCCN|nr:putative permease, DMT superfamily [Mycolicibacterium chubuense NBB4]